MLGIPISVSFNPRTGESLSGPRVPQSMPYDMCMYIQRNGFLKSSNEQDSEHTL